LPAGLIPAAVLRRVGGRRIVGKAQVGNATPYWNGSRWLDLGTCTGTSPAAFHPSSGEVYVSDALGVRVHARDGSFIRLIPGYIGSQGIRYVNADGSVVSGDETYGIAGQLGQHVRIGDARIGQGLAGGLDVVFDGESPRHICDGGVEFPRVHGTADALTCYWTDFRNGYRLDTSLAELHRLSTSAPPIVNAPPPIVNPPKPEPPSMPQPPKPEVPPVSLPDPSAVKAALTVARNHFPSATIGNVEMGHILNVVAGQFPGMGMHRKDGQAIQPVTGIGISHDVLRYLPPGDDFGWWSDVLGATGAGLATPVAPEWKRSTDDARSFVAPFGSPAPLPDPPPVPPPPAPSADFSAVLARLDLMDQRNDAQFAIQRAAAADTLQTLIRIAQAIELLKMPPPAAIVFPNYSGTARLGTTMRFTLEPVK
jgi:hypothetical protein